MERHSANVGIIGLGQMGLLHGGIANSLPGSSLKSLCDKDSMLTKIGSRLLPQIHFYTNYIEMIEKENLDAVFVCTPANTHASIIKEIAKCDIKGIFAEKPLSTSFNEASHLLEITGNLITMVGFQKRFTPTFAKAKEFLSKNILGNIRFFRSHFYTFENIQTGKGWKFEKGSGGVLLEYAPHLLDLLLWFFGEPTSITAKLASLHSNEVQDYAHAMMQYKNDLIGYFDVSWSMRNYRPGELMIEIHGDNGTLNATDSRLVLYLDHDIDELWKSGTHMIPVSELTPSLPFLVGHPEYVLIDQTFIEGVLTDTHSAPSFIDGANVNKFVDLANGNLERL